jgi:hypothetical protein
MTISLRIDVDNPFGYATLWKKVLNKVSLDFDLVPRSERLGYLGPARALKMYLDEKGVHATWFFRNITAPSGKTLRSFVSKNELALHAERSQSYDVFHAELREWIRRFGIKPAGFSKHGSGDLKLSMKHDKEYDPEKLIEYGKREKMRYFSGNGTDFKAPFENRDGLIYIPAVFWLDNPSLHQPSVSMNDLIRYSENKSLIVLVHPIWWVMRRDVKERLEYLTRNVTFEPLGDGVN